METTFRFKFKIIMVTETEIRLLIIRTSTGRSLATSWVLTKRSGDDSVSWSRDELIKSERDFFLALQKRKLTGGV
ncbi:hypothetical protein P5673_019372 [Acropora cervicornis]|uniref:Uncharacterized protein n=1 Tax=Acropora cervicornis TaxID=6130 RepID=A0AAD9QCA9_ACRCE|nr:hypothetical protein P5673_019372 [Acropora cervicornis]